MDSATPAKIEISAIQFTTYKGDLLHYRSK